jgi:adenylate cyclase
VNIQAVRPELVDFLRAQGLTDDEIAAAGEGRELIDLTLSMAILPSRRAYTLSEAAARAGADPEAATRLWRAMGFTDPEPDDRVATDIDVLALQGALEPVRTEEELEKSVEQTRVIAGAVSVVAEVWTDSLTKAAEEMADAGVRADDVAIRLRDSLELERLSFLLDYLHRRQLIAALERRLYWSPDSALSDQVLTVGFADLTGYTALTQQLDGHELDALVGRFESLTRDVIAEYGGRLVKTIGDEVMFLAANPIAGADLALRLVEAHTEDDLLPAVKVSLDSGPVLLRDGDAFGPTVNRASRMVDLAKPATVVVPSSVRDVLDPEPGFRLRPLGVRRLKDIGTTWLWAVTRGEAA